MASAEFILPNPIAKNNERTLIKGFGLPLVQRALLNTASTQPADAPDGLSKFGTPLYDTIFIERPEYTTFEWNDFTKKYDETQNVLASNKNIGGTQGLYIEGAILDVTRQRNIVTTEVAGYDYGTVKEYINNGDFNITIRGFVSTPYADKYPATDASLVNSYAGAPTQLKITSFMLNRIFGIDYIVVTSSNMFQKQGTRNVQYFEWQCLSWFDYQVNTVTDVEA